MAPYNFLRIFDTSGVLKAVITGGGRDPAGIDAHNGFTYLGWRKKVNDIYFAEFDLNYKNPDVQYLQDKNIIQIVRSDPAIGLNQYVSLTAVIRDTIEYTVDGVDSIKARAYGGNSLLARRRIAYPADISDRTKFSLTNGETIMKTLVSYNCDPALATVANGRDRDAPTMNMTVQADGTTGSTVYGWSCGGRQILLAELQKLARVAGGDFDVVSTSTNTFEFRFYQGQLGTDRTLGGVQDVMFSILRGNMLNPKLSRLRNSEKTVAIVAGRGQEENRKIAIVEAFSHSDENDIEIFVDARNVQDDTILDGMGEQALLATGMQPTLDFTALQTPLYNVEKDYFLGDLVLAEYNGLYFSMKVEEITFSYHDGSEDVDVKMSGQEFDPDGGGT